MIFISGLSILELSLVIAAKHLLDRRDGQPFNFEMVYNGMLGHCILFNSL